MPPGGEDPDAYVAELPEDDPPHVEAEGPPRDPAPASVLPLHGRSTLATATAGDKEARDIHA